MSLKRARSPSPAPAIDIPHPDARIYCSTPIEDRSSIFIAHYSPSLPAKSLQAHPEFKSATHRMAAWRKSSRQRALSASAPLLYDTGSDEDGERYAGKKMERVLEEMDVNGAVVVARWYGGVLLGPVRFNHIETCARQAIGKWVKECKNSGDEASKKRRVEADDDERKRLAQELTERDNSIAVLRALLTDKSHGTTNLHGNTGTTSSGSTSKAIDYTKMPLDALRRLDKARDATIAWLLREIDKAELEHNSQENNDVSSVSQTNIKPN